MWYTHSPSPLGTLLLVGTETHLVRLELNKVTPAPEWVRADERFATERAQLGAYFAGELTLFDLPLAPAGTSFQQRVWRALTEIPYGQTWSYGQLAQRIGAPGAARAVGLANGRNPLPIIVPCHRVIGSTGALTGYGGGIERKRWLLAHETRIAGTRLVLEHG